MRTSPGGRKRPELDRDMWDIDGRAYRCKECNKLFWHIKNPSENTIGGTKQIRIHQRRHS